MDTADKLLDEIFPWVEGQKRCAVQLSKLARELESLRKKCTAGNCVGNSLAVMGAACLIGAGVATFFTGGVAAPFLGALGAAYGGTGAAVTVGTMITEHFMTSDTMKDAEKLAQSNNEQGKKILELIRKLTKEREGWESEEETDEEAMYVVNRILAAMARRSGVTWHAEVDTSKRNKPADVDIRRHEREMLRYYRNDMCMGHVNHSFVVPVALLGFVGLFTLTTLKTTGGKTGKMLLTTGVGALTKNLSKTVLKTTVKGGSLVAGGVFGLALALPDAIDNWKQLVKENHVTEASQSLKDTAQKMDEASEALKRELDAIREMFNEMAKNCKENTHHQSHCNDEEKENDEDQSSETDQGTYSDEEKREPDEDEKTNTDDDKEREDDQDQRNDPDSDKETESDQDQESDSDSQETDTESETDQHQGAEIRMLLQNFGSLNKKFLDLSAIIRQYNPHIVLATETWFTNAADVDRRLKAALPPNYGFCHKDREGKKGGGVAIICSDAFLLCELIHLKHITTFEHLAVVLESNELPSPILVISVYYPPGYPGYQQFLEQFEQLLQAIPSKYNHILIAGDFNIRIGKDIKKSQPFNELLERHGFIQHVNTPTHRTDFRNQTDHILDLVITRGLDGSVSVKKSNISDHYSVIFDATLKSSEADKKKKKKKKLNKTKRGKKT